MLAWWVLACTTPKEPATLVVAYQSRGEGEIEPCG